MPPTSASGSTGQPSGHRQPWKPDSGERLIVLAAQKHPGRVLEQLKLRWLMVAFRPRDLRCGVEYSKQYVGSQPEFGGASALSVLLVRRGGSKPGLDFLSHDRPLRLDIEHPPLHLGGAQA